MIIGGEYTFSPAILLKRSKAFIDSLIKDVEIEYHINFTFGGFYSILAILDDLQVKLDNDSLILLPSYICPSILKPFKLRGIKYKFYKVDDNLFIDTEYLISIIDKKVKAVFFIDYFGASQLDRIKPVLVFLKLKQISVIQDVVQCLKINKEDLFGDYIFNSFRKFFPFEGSLLLSKDKLNIKFGRIKGKYVVYKRIGQLIRFFHIKYSLFSSKHFLSFLQKAESHYYSNYIMGMPKFNRKQLNKYDIKLLANRQKYFFNKLFKTYSDKVPLLLHKSKLIPLGFVIKIERRDEIRAHLFEENIFAPIHWILPEEIDVKVFDKSIKLSSLILTLPLTGITSEKYNYLSSSILKYVKIEGLS
jgi:hypothetical protein